MAADLSFHWHIYIFKGFWGVQRGFLQKAPLVVLPALSLPDKPKFTSAPEPHSTRTRTVKVRVSPAGITEQYPRSRALWGAS